MIVGHVAASPITVAGRPCGWSGLGPVAVVPERQGAGIGTALCRVALARLRDRGAEGCVLLGDEGFYGRLGFEADPRLTLPGAPPEHFLALPFGDAVPAGAVAYRPAFDAP